MASGWNLWVWLECIGVVSGCCSLGEKGNVLYTVGLVEYWCNIGYVNSTYLQWLTCDVTC